MARDLVLEQRWRERIKERRQSGLTVKVWCFQNELTERAYYYWIKRFKVLDRQEVVDHPFVEVPLSLENQCHLQKNERTNAGLTLSFGSYSIGIPNGFNPDTLVEIVKVLQKL